MEQQPLTVFISHSKDDADFARRLYQYLRSEKMRVWLAETELAVGDSIVESVDKAIQRTDVVVAVLSRASLDAKWFKYEVERALENPDLTIIFVSLDGSELPSSAANLPCIRGTGETEFPYDEVVTQIKRSFPDAIDYEEPHDSIPEISEMIGRHDALQRLEEIVSKNRAVAIVGMAGMGKTTLAAATAHWARDTRLVDRVVWVHGNHLNEAGFVSELVRVLKLAEPGTSIDIAMEMVSDSLATTSTLIVVDDASDASLRVVHRLNRDLGLDRSRVLITSRSRALEGTGRDFVAFDLDALTSHEAVTLLERLLIGHNVDMSEQDARQIVQETAGHPLTLSLIAGQLRAGTSPTEVLDHLRAIPSLPTSETLPSTMKQALDYTYDALSDDERNVLNAIKEFGDTAVSIRTVSTIAGIADSGSVRKSVERLAARGVVSLDDDRVSTDSIVREYLNQRNAETATTPRTLYVTVDPELMGIEDFVELLDTLNMIYTQLGGDELIIREDEIGRFTKAGVLV